MAPGVKSVAKPMPAKLICFLRRTLSGVAVCLRARARTRQSVAASPRVQYSLIVEPIHSAMGTI